MTIGLGMAGPRAGLAVLRALAAVERVGRGAIGGFVSMAVITTDGQVVRAETQNGGSASLHPDAVAAMSSAPFAALISSGPNRPPPLSRFVAADPRFGLVTGHRFPVVLSDEGIPLNQCVLERMAAGDSAGAAVPRLVHAYPDIDAGLIAVALNGDVFADNTHLVAQRSDRGAALQRSDDGTVSVAVLHNSIHPVAPLAELAAWTALDVAQPPDVAMDSVLLRRGAKLVASPRDALCLTADGDVDRIETRQLRLLRPDPVEGSPVLAGTIVMRAEQPIGIVVSEPYCVSRDGQVFSVDGADGGSVAIRPLDARDRRS